MSDKDHIDESFKLSREYAESLKELSSNDDEEDESDENFGECSTKNVKKDNLASYGKLSQIKMLSLEIFRVLF